MKGKRLFGHWALGVLMVLMMCAFLPTEAKAASYSDVEGHWAQPAIERWSESGILNGYEDGRFGPNDPMTRAELAAVLYRLWGCQPREGLAYADLDPKAWYYDALTTMEHYEIALGRGDHIYPNEKLTREEAFYMVGRALGFSDKTEEAPRAIDNISDWEDIDTPYFKCIRIMFSEGALKGSDDGKFHPGDPVTRAQVITVIDNIFDVCISEPGEYTLQCSQVALVLCGDVKITYTGKGVYKRGISGYYITAYLMDKVGPRGVTMVRDPELGTKQLRVEVRGVKSVEPDQNATNDPWTCEGYDPCFTVGDQRGGMLGLEWEPNNCHILFAGGIGTKTYPYQIKTGEQFLALSKVPGAFTYVSHYAELCNDIEIPQDQILNGSIRGISLDGKGHTVKLSVRGTYEPESGDFGLFTYISYGVEISNLNLVGEMDVTIEDPNLENTSFTFQRTSLYELGVLAGNCSGTIQNCTSAVNLTVRYAGEWAQSISVGNMVGKNTGDMMDCTFTGNMAVYSTGKNVKYLYVGGLAGKAAGGVSDQRQMRGLTASGKIKVSEPTKTAEIYVGGIAGSAAIDKKEGSSSVEEMLSGTKSTADREDFGQRTDLSDCGAVADISVDGGYIVCAGGLLGLRSVHAEMPRDLPTEEYGVLENCWSTATITVKGMGFEGDCGGLIGQHFAGVVRSCWAKPVISVEDKDSYHFHNVGAVVGKAVEIGSVSDCWGDASGVDVKTTSGLYHYGGIMGRQDTKLTNCFVLGNSRLAPENAISYKPWSFADVVNCVDLTNATAEQRKAFYESCGWDFETVWDNSGVYPILRGCDADAQREAQGL